MTTVLAALSVLVAIVIVAMMVVALVEGADRRRR